MPTTEANSAKPLNGPGCVARIYLYPSRLARIFHLLTHLILIWAVTFSQIPLALSLYLITVLIRVLTEHVALSATGWLEVADDGSFRLGSKRGRCVRIVTLYTPVMLSIKGDNGEVIRIWRDGCPEKEYRRLLLVIRLWTSRDKGAE